MPTVTVDDPLQSILNKLHSGPPSGSSTRTSRAGRDMPMPLAASTSAGSTPRRPTIALRTIGSSPYSVSAMTVGATPRPTSGISRPIRASEGMVSTVEVEVTASVPAQPLRYVSTPIRTPSTVAITMHCKTALACWKASVSSC